MVLNRKPVDKWERINCTTVKFYLPSIWIPLSAAICSNHMHRVVNGLDLRAGRMYSLQQLQKKICVQMQKIESESKTQIYNTVYKSGIMVRKCSGVVGKLGLQQAK